MRNILVVNPKGGCGKTTIATNLAGYYASKERDVSLVDLDKQRSSYQWAMSRDKASAAIGIYTSLEEDYSASRVIFDCPAQIHGREAAQLINLSDVIVMPINPSIIDHRAAFKFIFDIRNMVRANKCKSVKIGLVANRVDSNFNSYTELEKFAKMMQTPIITSLRNSQNYVTAAADGISIFEMPHRKIAVDRDQWKPLNYWAEGKLLKRKNYA